jgi:hypothetical protein
MKGRVLSMLSVAYGLFQESQESVIGPLTFMLLLLYTAELSRIAAARGSWLFLNADDLQI